MNDIISLKNCQEQIGNVFTNFSHITFRTIYFNLCAKITARSIDSEVGSHHQNLNRAPSNPPNLTTKQFRSDVIAEQGCHPYDEHWIDQH